MPIQGNIRIEEHALGFLSTYYARHPKSSGLLINKAVMTKQGAQADGLVTYRRQDNSCFAASLSVRQSDALATILRNYKRNGLGKLRYLTAATLFTATALTGNVLGQWIVLWVLPLFMAVAGFYLHSRLKKRQLHRKLAAAVSEIKHLPADEQWLGIRVSSLCWRKNALAERLEEMCRHRGIGLVTVGKRARPTLRQDPRTADCRRADFLCYYAAEANLRQELDTQFMRVA